MRITCTIGVVLVVVGLIGSTAGAAFISDDFQTGVGNWVTSGFSRVDLGGGQFVLTDTGSTGSTTSLNTTPLPAALQIDYDFAVTRFVVPQAFSFNFHMANSYENPFTQKGYELRYVDDYGTVNDGLQLWDRSASYGTVTKLAQVNSTPNTSTHHVRIADDGVGHIRVYWDNTTIPVISIDDTASYLGGANQYVGVYGRATMTGWIDNVVVSTPEPVTIALLGLVLPVLMRRR